MKISKQDYKFVAVDPDPNFSPEHNQRVVEETIKESDRNWRIRQRELSEQRRERASAVARYIKAIDTGQTESDVIKYFGRKETARLRGEEIKSAILAKLGDATKKKIQSKEDYIKRHAN